jgi:Zn-finger nucleic acid-binding protein
MKCPACGNQLKEMDVEGVKVDACDGGCAGIWFDNFEIGKFDEPHEPAGALLKGIARNESVTVNESQKRNCPRCENIVMLRHCFSIKQEVEVDECAGCAGIWLDHGELEKIRNLFETAEAREEAAQAQFTQMLEELDQAESQSKVGSKLPNLFGFLR